MKEQRRREEFPHLASIPTRWRDNDVYGHVNNVVYYEFMDTVINRYLVDAGGFDLFEDPVVGFAVETACNFYRPLRFPEVLEAGLAVAHLGRTSVRYEVGLFSRGAEELAALGRFVHVFVDRATRRPAPPKDSVRAALEALRGPAGRVE